MNAGPQEKLLRWLGQCARSGEACPPNDIIRERLGIRSPSGFLARLAREGLIVVHYVDRPRGRRVTIVATGETTAVPVGISPPKKRGLSPNRTALA